MDKLANRLREDAANIEVRVSDELDRRIAASLERVAAESRAAAPRRKRRPALFWWASSLTGLAAAVAVIAILNIEEPPGPVSATPDNFVADLPAIDLRAETAMLAGPLQKELDALESDLRKAEERIRSDIGL
jgi:hypothetical protein